MSNVFFSNNVWFFLSHCVIPELDSGSHFIFSKIIFDFFTTPRHPELDSGSLFIFSKSFWFFFLSLLCFYFFIKIITTSSKGKEPARSPKPAVSFPLNPFLLGHGSGLRPKNLPPSEVSSVSYEQIRVALFFFQNSFWFFLSQHVILNVALLRTHLLRRMIQDLTRFFSKVFDSFF